ncbi:MAG TPA: cupredoxin domain-containing protein [Terriglobales bacterium]|nr:cupredoxin domain-containing protein [Terriglobales bacterium]
MMHPPFAVRSGARFAKSVGLAVLLVSMPLSLAWAAPHAAPAPQKVAIRVTSKGFEPATIRLQAGRPTVLVVTRTTDRTCVLDFVLKDRRIKQPLPLGRPVEIRLPAEKPGRLRFACGMDMCSGTLVIQ